MYVPENCYTCLEDAIVFHTESGAVLFTLPTGEVTITPEGIARYAKEAMDDEAVKGRSVICCPHCGFCNVYIMTPPAHCAVCKWSL